METKANLLPIVMGNEEETGLQVTDLEHPKRLLDEHGVTDLCEKLPIFIPDNIRSADSQYTLNGFRIYIGQTEFGDLTNPERATPECRDPDSLTTYMRASEAIFQTMLKNYVQFVSDDEDEPFQARWQRRVVDSNNSRKASHDNYGFIGFDKEQLEDIASNITFQSYIATAGMVTGAGHINRYGLNFTQKMDGLEDITGKAYKGTICNVFLESEATESVRFEVRCNDINISDWAARNRVGSMAMFLALIQTEAAEKLKPFTESLEIEAGNVFSIRNMCWIEDDISGGLKLTSRQQAGLDFQLKATELMLDSLPNYTDLPDSYFRIALARYKFLEDLKYVAGGSAEDVKLLADRADWAAKFHWVLRRKEKDEEFGLSRSTTDYIAQSQDLSYDLIEIKALPGETASVRKGMGYKLRDRGVFLGTVDEKDVKKAEILPPQDTRAKARKELLKNYYVLNCYWEEITVGFDEHDNVAIELEPLHAELTDNQKAILEYFRYPSKM